MINQAPHTDSVVGTEIDGRYRIERFLGAGTMGAVYEATQVSVERRVAVKLLNAALQTHDEVRERFRLEAQAIAALNHPNCITLFDFGYSEKLSALYMVIEYLEGRTLQEYIFDGIDMDLALEVTRQIADVCAHAHQAGILHRDLKPDNVMLVEGPDGTLISKVLDFGLARIFDAAAETRLTHPGQVFGTPAYMSPEQCGGELDVTAAADVYALGVAFYEMLSGQLPFDSEKVPELLVMHARDPVPPIESVELGPDITELVESMLAKDPDDRPTAREVADRLRDHLDGSENTPRRDRLGSDVPTDTSNRATVQTPDSETDRTAADTGRTDMSNPFSVPFRRDRKIVMTAVVFLLVGIAAAVALLVSVDHGPGTLNGVSATPGVPKSVWEPLPARPPSTSQPTTGLGEASHEAAQRAASRVANRARTIASSPPEPGADQRESLRTPGIQKPSGRNKKRPGDESSQPSDEPSSEPSTEKSKKFRKLEFNY